MRQVLNECQLTTETFCAPVSAFSVITVTSTYGISGMVSNKVDLEVHDVACSKLACVRNVVFNLQRASLSHVVQPVKENTHSRSTAEVELAALGVERRVDLLDSILDRTGQV